MTTVIQNRNDSRSSKTVKDGVVYQIVLESTDSDDDDQSNESLYSLQAETTISAKDSSDISTEFSSEFELATSPEMGPHPWSFNPDLSSSGNSPHRMHNEVEIREIQIEESEDYGISSDSSVDNTNKNNKIRKFPQCVMCLGTNDNSFFQLCHSCYQIRKEFFPEKPKARKRKHVQDSVSLQNRHENEDVPEKKIALSISNEELFKDEQNNSNELLTGSSTSSSLESVSTEDSGIEIGNADIKKDEKCLTCFMKDMDALFLHGKTGHRCCCYQCAKRIWFETRRCPICRSKVNNIIKILN